MGVFQMRHKHADLIIEWANGAQIQYYDALMCRWSDYKNPKWHEAIKFRVKPEPKPDVVVLYGASAYQTGLIVDPWENPNLKLTFSGETGELKAAEVMR